MSLAWLLRVDREEGQGKARQDKAGQGKDKARQGKEQDETRDLRVESVRNRPRCQISANRRQPTGTGTQAQVPGSEARAGGGQVSVPQQAASAVRAAPGIGAAASTGTRSFQAGAVQWPPAPVPPREAPGHPWTSRVDWSAAAQALQRRDKPWSQPLTPSALAPAQRPFPLHQHAVLDGCVRARAIAGGASSHNGPSVAAIASPPCSCG